MKKLIILLVLGLVAVGFAAAQVSRGGTLYVATKTLALKSGTGFFASTRATLNYGDRVTVLQVNGRFVEVRHATNQALSGWTASANLSARQIVSGTTGSASASEVAMAAKGFNQEVESNYRSQGNYNYADVDRIEAFNLNMDNLRRFLEDGRLSTGSE
jgi:uncharacterized protein YgiM (DUF1202 family)